MRIIVLFVLLFFLPSVVFSANLYKWRDSSGKLFITDSPPPRTAYDVSGLKYVKRKQSLRQVQTEAIKRNYQEQSLQRHLIDNQRRREVRKYNKQIEDHNDHYYEQEKARLELKIAQCNNRYDFRDPKKVRDHYRNKIKYYKKQLKALKRSH